MSDKAGWVKFINQFSDISVDRREEEKYKISDRDWEKEALEEEASNLQEAWEAYSEALVKYITKKVKEAGEQ